MEQATAVARKCSKCSGEMEIGFLPDRSYAVVLPAVWVAGFPERKWIGGLKVTDRPAYRVETWRCKGCGNLESYAQTQLA